MWRPHRLPVELTINTPTARVPGVYAFTTCWMAGTGPPRGQAQRQPLRVTALLRHGAGDDRQASDGTVPCADRQAADGEPSDQAGTPPTCSVMRSSWSAWWSRTRPAAIAGSRKDLAGAGLGECRWSPMVPTRLPQSSWPLLSLAFTDTAGLPAAGGSSTDAVRTRPAGRRVAVHRRSLDLPIDWKSYGAWRRWRQQRGGSRGSEDAHRRGDPLRGVRDRDPQGAEPGRRGCASRWPPMTPSPSRRTRLRQPASPLPALASMRESRIHRERIQPCTSGRPCVPHRLRVFADGRRRAPRERALRCGVVVAPDTIRLGSSVRSKICKGLPIGPLRGPIGNPSRRDRRVAASGVRPGAGLRGAQANPRPP
jgi:hypothetical protein